MQKTFKVRRTGVTPCMRLASTTMDAKRVVPTKHKPLTTKGYSMIDQLFYNGWARELMIDAYKADVALSQKWRDEI